MSQNRPYIVVKEGEKKFLLCQKSAVSEAYHVKAEFYSKETVIGILSKLQGNTSGDTDYVDTFTTLVVELTPEFKRNRRGVQRSFIGVAQLSEDGLYSRVFEAQHEDRALQLAALF